MTSVARVAAVVGLLGMFCGCANDAPLNVSQGSVTGKVTYKGNPVAKGRVAYSNKKGGAGSADIQSDGTYSIPALNTGEYDVYVTPPEVQVSKEDYDKFMKGELKELPKADAPDIPEKYRTAESSGLKTTIKEGANTYDVKMD